MGIARSWSRRACAALALVCLAAAAAPPATAQTFEEALAAYDRGDYAAAVRGFRSCAEQGDANAQYHLGVMYEYGRGVPQDSAEVAKWYRRAAEQGLADAQWQLGVMYESGAGVLRDYVQAHKWYSISVSRFPISLLRDSIVWDRDRVASKLTPNELARAKRMAREWRPRTETAAQACEPRDAGADARRRIRDAQRNLARLGYDPGPDDGAIGPKTRAAIRAFERDNGLPVTGVLTRAVYSAIGRSSAAR